MSYRVNNVGISLAKFRGDYATDLVGKRSLERGSLVFGCILLRDHELLFRRCRCSHINRCGLMLDGVKIISDTGPSHTSISPPIFPQYKIQYRSGNHLHFSRHTFPQSEYASQIHIRRSMKSRGVRKGPSEEIESLVQEATLNRPFPLNKARFV